ncbi:hypothetical protein [Streptomyces sp. NPDC048172]|uniref:hypothetical protein n=1 Tax=Streptomyces sp. NPDC048172 TaxID=3365505 RepID=UPI003717528D
MRRTRAMARGVALVGGIGISISVALAACGTGDGEEGGSAAREERYERVLKDPHPSPADVIEAAGAPATVARAGDGSLLLTYDVDPVEDDEGPAASAWRLFSPSGRTVADGARHRDAEGGTGGRFVGLRDGFVHVPPGEDSSGGWLLDTRGKRHKVTTADAALGTRPGDVLLSESEPTLLYRPATRTIAPVAHVPRDAHRLAVDERGTAWSLDQPLSDDPNRVVRQRAGRTQGSAPLPRSYTGGAVAARGGTAAVSLVRGGGVRGVLVTGDGGAHWRTVTGGGVPWKRFARGPESFVLEVLSDGRLLVGEEGGRAWLADDRTNRAFHPLKPPSPPASFTTLTAQGTTLYGIADTTTATYGLAAGEGLWTSRDGGGTWKRHGNG